MNEQSLNLLCTINPETLGMSTPADFEFRYLDISAVTKGHIDWSATRLWKYADAPSRARRRLRCGDALLCTVRPGLQAHARIGRDDPIPLVGSTGFAVLRPNVPTDAGFIFHQLFSNSVAAQLRALETGSSYPAVNESDVRRLRLFAPAPEERKRIAAMLDTVDDAIAKTEAVIAKLKQVRAGLLHDLLTRGLDEHGHLRDPITHSEQFQDSPLGRIPAAWELVPVENAGEVRLGRQRSPTHETGQHIRPYLRVANVFDGLIDYSDVLSMNFDLAEQDTYSLRTGDILLNEGQSLELVGRSAIFYGPAGVFCFQNTLVRFRCNATTIPEYCQAVFKYWLDTRTFTRVARQTTSVAHLGADRFATMPFPRPPRNEQRMIAIRIAQIADMQAAEEAGLRKLQDLKSGLMADLLTGRVRVSEEVLE